MEREYDTVAGSVHFTGNLGKAEKQSYRYRDRQQGSNRDDREAVAQG